MRNLFLIFSILFCLSGFAQTRLLSDTSLPKKIIKISDLYSIKNKISHLDSMAVYGEASYYESYSHHLRKEEEEQFRNYNTKERLKSYFYILTDKKRKITKEGFKTLDSVINFVLVDTINRRILYSSPMPDKYRRKELKIEKEIYKYLTLKLHKHNIIWAYDFYFRKYENPFIKIVFDGKNFSQF